MKGIVLGDRYELLEKIGEGGMSEVFKARCNKLNRFVAVKILKKEFCNNEDIVEKFKGEATAIATLSDNNIVNILDVGTQDDINYIVMEYVKGKTLKDVIKQVGKMNYETGISVAIQIAKALDCAHRNQIIHRDVKPQNILVTEDGIMKVTDFGIAKSATSSTITNTSTIMGSAHYLSPEQAKGSFIDCRTDLYSLGVVIYEMVTGVVPFEGDSAVTIALKHIQNEVIPPKEINSKIPDSLNKLILKAMEKNPNKRYQTAKEMIADLQKIKNNPNAVIDGDSDENEHTIIMSAVSDDMLNDKSTDNAGSTRKDDKHNKDIDEDEDDDDYYYDYDDYDEDEYEDDDDDDSRTSKSKKGKKNIKNIIIGVLCVLVLGIAVYAGTNLTKKPTASQIEVPNLIGKTEDEAKAELEKLNLVLVNGGDDTTSDQPKGTVTKSSPAAGTSVEENTKVRVLLSAGGKVDKMPDLTERDLKTAKSIVESMGLKLSDDVEYEYSDDVEKGKIISQTPKKSEEVSSDTVVKVVVSSGPKVQKKQVPNVVDLTQDSASAKLSELGFNVNFKYNETTTKTKDGIVLSQSINAGDTRAVGTTITITIWKYKEPVVTPPQNNQNSQGNTGTNGNTGNGNSGNSGTGTGNGTGTGTGNGTSGNTGTGNNGNTTTPSNPGTGTTPEGPWEDNNSTPGNNNTGNVTGDNNNTTNQ